MKFDIISKKKIWFSIPLIILIITMIAFAVFAGIGKSPSNGIAIGLEFQGGSLITVQLGTKVETDYNNNVSKIRQIIEKNGGAVSFIQKSGTGSAASLLFKYSIRSVNDDNKENDIVINEIRQAYPDEQAAIGDTFVSHNFIGPTASSRLVKTAVLAVIISTLLMLIYVFFRFEKWSAISSVVGLLLNVFIMFAMMIIFHLQINSTFIAAMITIVSYSINNSIVVFDRIRENYSMLDYESLGHEYIINISVKDTMVRSITTTATTMIPIILFAILGVSAVREFALPVIFGLMAGLFTSTCISPVLYSVLKGADIKRNGRAALPYRKGGQKATSKK